ncbi:MAG: dihydroxy-acid dehydratase, partial [Candidatus Acidiferrales bacterium]
MRSDAIKKGLSRAPARAMLKATGLTDADLERPFVAVINTWAEVTPCNFHLRRLAEKVKEGIRAAGGTPIEFNTIVVSDGISMGTEGMKASLVSREVIADSIELVVRGHCFDAVVALSGCDKTIPGTVMALARLDLPSLMLYGGSILPGQFQGRDVTIQDVFEAVGACATGRITPKELGELENKACPGAGACGGQFTANTMSTAISMLGMSPMGANDIPALDARKDEAAFRCGQLVLDVLRNDLRPSRIITRPALENAIAAVATTGGSTNAVLHLLAIAQEAGVPLVLDDFDTVASRTPLLVDLKPGGRFTAPDLDRAGGTRLVAKRLLDAGLLHDGLTVTGRALFEEARAATETPNQQVVRPLTNPLKSTGGLAILRGSLAPEGCVVKLAGHERMQHTGPARVFDCEEAAFEAVQQRAIKPGDVVVIRYEGPKGGPGMREMLAVTGALVGQGL